MSATTLRASIREILLDLFPWLGRIGLTPAGDLGIRSATTKIDLADPAPTAGVVRVGDLGDAGTFSVTIVPGELLWTGADGSAWSITLTSATPGSPVVIAIVPVTGDAGRLVTLATTGSTKVRAG